MRRASFCLEYHLLFNNVPAFIFPTSGSSLAGMLYRCAEDVRRLRHGLHYVGKTVKLQRNEFTALLAGTAQSRNSES